MIRITYEGDYNMGKLIIAIIFLLFLIGPYYACLHNDEIIALLLMIVNGILTLIISSRSVIKLRYRIPLCLFGNIILTWFLFQILTVGFNVSAFEINGIVVWFLSSLPCHIMLAIWFIEPFDEEQKRQRVVIYRKKLTNDLQSMISEFDTKTKLLNAYSSKSLRIRNVIKLIDSVSCSDIYSTFLSNMQDEYSLYCNKYREYSLPQKVNEMESALLEYSKRQNELTNLLSRIKDMELADLKRIDSAIKHKHTASIEINGNKKNVNVSGYIVFGVIILIVILFFLSKSIISQIQNERDNNFEMSRELYQSYLQEEYENAIEEYVTKESISINDVNFVNDFQVNHYDGFYSCDDEMKIYILFDNKFDLLALSEQCQVAYDFYDNIIDKNRFSSKSKEKAGFLTLRKYDNYSNDCLYKGERVFWSSPNVTLYIRTDNFSYHYSYVSYDVGDYFCVENNDDNSFKEYWDNKFPNIKR